MSASILWRRLDIPGHDACCIEENDAGWTLDGAAVFSEDGVPAKLAYQVTCDLAWQTRKAYVRGWIGGRFVALRVVRTPEGTWFLNGTAVSNLESCTDLDLWFTPATNLIPVHRLALSIGQMADAPAAWLDVSAATLERLPQHYERRAETTYWYEAPSMGYAASLDVTPIGFVRRYPGLWEAELDSKATSLPNMAPKDWRLRESRSGSYPSQTEKT